MVTRSRKRTVQWNIFFGYLTMFLSLVSGIFLVPLYLRYIPLDLYGAWLATGNILVWITTIDPGLSTLLLQRVGNAYGKNDVYNLRDFIMGGVLLSVLIAGFIMAIGLFSVRYVPGWLALPSDMDIPLLQKAFFIVVIGSSASIFSYSFRAICQGLQGSVGIGLIDVTVRVFGIILIVILLLNGFGLYALALGSLFTGIGAVLGLSGYLLWRLMSEKIGFTFSLRKIPELAKLMSFTFMGRATGMIANNMDLFIVSRFLGPEIVPLLHLTRRVPKMATAFFDKPTSAFSPVISHLSGAGEIDKARIALLRYFRILFWLLGLVIGGCVALNDDFVRLWVGSHLFAGQTINLIICGNLVLIVASSCFAILCVAMGNIKGSSLASMAEGLLFIPLIIFGTKYFGLLGAVLAPFIAKLATTAWYFPHSFSKLLKLSRKVRRDIIREIFAIAAIGVPLTLCFFFIHPTGWLQFITLAITFCLFYGFGLYLISTQLRSEIKGILQRLAINKA